MKLHPNNKLDQPIVLVDRQRARREQYASALRAEGFLVYACDTARAPALLDTLFSQVMLEVLNCSSIGADEEQVIQAMLARHCHLLVLCDRVPLSMLRVLFLQGVDDIADQPRSPEQLVDQIHEALIGLVPRNSYQAVEREMFYEQKKTYSDCR